MKQQFNDTRQLKAIEHGYGPACVLAGPGSGKTYIIIHRIQNLIKNYGVKPDKILVITFTKAAAIEMRQRFLDISKGEGCNVTFGTFHSVYLSFLKYFRSNTVPNIIESSMQRKIIDEILSKNHRLKGNIYFSNDKTEDLVSAISFYKSGDRKVPSFYPKELFIEFINEYEECLNALNLMDFDDILINCRDMLLKDPEYSDILKNRFHHILVDEFQDINPIQYEILKMILNDDKNLFVVGDDDQAIYGFRGATPDIIRIFFEDFKNAEKIELDMNYRCRKNIIDASLRVISHDRNRIKNVSFKSKFTDDPGLFDIRIFESKSEEYEYIKNLVSDLKSKNKTVCVLARTNKDVLKISDYLKNNTYSLENGEYEKDLEGEICKDLCAYISFCKNGDRGSLLRIIKTMDLYLSKDIFTESVVDLNIMSSRYRGTLKGHQLEKLERIVKTLKRSSPFAFLTFIFNIAGYKEYLSKKYSGSLKTKALKLLDTYLQSASKAGNLDELYISLNERSLKNDHRSNKEKPMDVMTFHSSKGLEFDAVILPDVNEGKIPGRASLENCDSEEERRLFYVAMTRAKEALYITAIKGNDSMRMLPSRFITEFLEQ